MSRRSARERAVQTLYSLELNESDIQEALNGEIHEDVAADSFAEQLVNGVIENKTAIDEMLRDKLENWKLERVGRVERAILRVSVYEMKFLKELPLNVVFNEAIELGKTFCDDKSSKFINGVLSKIKE